MNATKSYLRQRYELTRWPYYSITWTRFEVGSSFDLDIKELREKEMVQPVPGINGWLIEILDFETKWNKI